MNNKQNLKHLKNTILSSILIICFYSTATSQRFNSLVGARISSNTIAFSAKIALDEKNYLEGTIGVITPQPEYTIGAGAAYHRHIALTENRNFQFYYGGSGKAVLGDERGLGLGLDAGLIYIYKKISFGADFFPTYFFNDALGLRPLYGINLRWVND